MGIICLLFITSNFVLMPLINKYRDSGQEKKFKISHFLSVIINFIHCFIDSNFGKYLKK